MHIIDTHQHLWDLDQFPYSWTNDHPAFRRNFNLDDYMAATTGLELVKSVLVEADVDEPYIRAETEHMLSLAEDPETVITGVIAAARPEYDNFPEDLKAITGRPGLKGIRRVLHTQPDYLAVTTTFIENIRSLADFGLTFDICVRSRQMAQANSLIRECPEVQFILDHCGNPDLNGGNLAEWRERIAEAAMLPNVTCKVSGIVVNTAGPDWTIDDLRPAVDHVIGSFGWDRVMFGSDWPVCTLTSTCRRWVEAVCVITEQAGEENRRKLFYENAMRVYNL